MEINQLLLSKYLFKKGLDFLRKDDPVSCGIAISLFQDSSEMLLRAVAKHVDANISEKETFDKYWDKIEIAKKNTSHIAVPLKAHMIDVNKARVNFKHYGQPPNPAHAITFSDYVERFLRETMKLFFDADYNDISAGDLIRDKEIRETIKEAERSFQNGQLTECMIACAKASYLIDGSLRSIIPEFEQNNDISSFLRKHDSDRHLEMLLKDIFGNLNSLRLLGIAALLDVNIADFIRFSSLVPKIFKYASGKWTSAYLKKNDCSEDEARFCLNYIIEYALTVQNHHHEYGKGRFKLNLSDFA